MKINVLVYKLTEYSHNNLNNENVSIGGLRILSINHISRRNCCDLDGLNFLLKHNGTVDGVVKQNTVNPFIDLIDFADDYYSYYMKALHETALDFSGFAKIKTRRNYLCVVFKKIKVLNKTNNKTVVISTEIS